MATKVPTVAAKVENENKHEVDLDHALSVAGFGWYNIKYCVVLALFLIASLVEMIGYAYVLPAAKCDLLMTDAQRGIISSLPYLAVVTTSFPWGYLVDTRGRKSMVVISSLAVGGFGILAAFMPNLLCFTICKFLASMCIACPSAVPYSFIGEILPPKYRDISLSVTNSVQTFGSALVPLLAWGILPLDFNYNFVFYYFRPWRALTLVYSSLFVLAGFLMSLGPESPKYLLSQGKHDEAIDVLRVMFASNKSKPADDFPIKLLKMENEQKTKSGFLKSLKEQSYPLTKPPYIKWMLLNGFLLFGAFAVLNGLFMWVPDILNRVLKGNSADKTACQIIGDRLNGINLDDKMCDDTIETNTFIINSIANCSCALAALAASLSLKVIDKKILIVLMYTTLGMFCIITNYITEDIIFAVLLSSLQITAVSIGPVNAYAIEIFPTYLRGMAVSLCLMMGRIGSIAGTNVAGILINQACESTFYTFGGLLLLCGCLSLCLPNSKHTVK